MRKALFVIYCICSLYSLAGQGLNELWCHELGTDQGLTAQGYNFYTYKDSSGFVWINSTKGLNRFDGHTVRQFRGDLKDSTALYGDNVQSQFFEDAEQNIWFCTYEAIHCYDRKNDVFQHYFLKDKQGNTLKEGYRVFYLEQQKYLWIRVLGKVHRVDVSVANERQKYFSESKTILKTDYLHCWIGAGDDGKVNYVFSSDDAKSKGLAVFDVSNLNATSTDLISSSEKFDQTSFYQVFFEKENAVWLASDKGLIKWDIKADTSHLYPTELSHYLYIAPYGQRYIIASIYDKGLYLFDKETGLYTPYKINVINQPLVNIGDSYRNVYLDKDNVLWITIPGKGVLYAHLEKTKFKNIKKEATTSKGITYLNFLAIDKDRVLLTHEHGMMIYDTEGNEIKTFRDVSENLSYKYTFLSPDFSNQVFIATQKGIYIRDLENGRLDLVDGTANIHFLCIAQLKTGEVLASSFGRGIFLLEKKRNKWSSREIPNTNAGIYTSLYQDTKGQIYACKNESSIDIFSYEKGSLVIKQDLPIKGAVYTYSEDVSQQILWIGTSLGLVKVNAYPTSKDIELFSVKNGLPDNVVQSIQQKDNQNIWLSTYRGLCLFNGKDETFKTFTLSDGALSTYFNSYAGLSLANGSIWFGGTNGVTIVPPNNISYVSYNPNIILNDLKVDDESHVNFKDLNASTNNVNELQSLTLSYPKNTISFEFMADDYIDPGAGVLAYKMKGVDESWVKLKQGELGNARYPNMPSGEYEFVMSMNSMNDRNTPKAQRSINITVLPPIWETWWFRSLMAVFSLLILFFLIRNRLKQVREKEQLQTRIAENKMAALVGQMKPHFIFNSLQSVNRFILKENRKQASEYLGQFSGLIRLMLENSRNTQHTLEEEINFLKLYLRVESQRFSTAFQYDIVMDDKMDVYNIDIPTMMLQPFVENAIWHGVSHKESGIGSIAISINKKDELLQCHIEDNGIGRKKAAEIAKQMGKSHKSRALLIVQERLQLLFPEQQHLCDISYTDLMDENGVASGTKVSISLPLIY